MQCKICGNNLVRGFTFCLECGNPVPADMLEESGLPPRNIDRGPQEEADGAAVVTDNLPQNDEEVSELKPKLVGGEQERGKALRPELKGGDEFDQGKALKPRLMGVGEDEAGEALKPRFIGGEEQTGGGEKVRATLQNSSDDVNDTAVEKLVFCPNCGMHMQHHPSKCEICGMALGNMPNNVPKSQSGMPLFNTEPDAFSGTGGFGGFGGFGGLSDADVSSAVNFAGGNADPMFNSGSSAFNVQATPADFSRITEQLANFSSAAGMTNIEETQNTRIRQKAAPKGKDVELDDFSMTDDLQSESVPMSDSHVPVVGDYSMEDDPDDNLNIDPFAFVGMSMDEDPPMPLHQADDSFEGIPAAASVEQQPEPVPVKRPELAPIGQPEPVPEEQPAKRVSAEPVQPPSPFGRTVEEELDEQTPFIAEESPVPPEPISVKRPEPKAVDPFDAPRQPEPKSEAPRQTVKETPKQSARDIEMTPPVQAQPTAQKPAEKTKKCFACGRVMPAKDKFCPNCGRSMFGIPNPNIERPSPPPPKSKKPPIALIIAIIVAVIAVVVVIIVLSGSGKAAEIDFENAAQTVSDAELTLWENIIS